MTKAQSRKEVNRKKITGVVVSDKMDKTVVVAENRLKAHPLYKKQYNVTSKYMAHDPENSAKEGDIVTIELTRPLSSKKRWRVVSNKTKNLSKKKS